jgi:hypothetical protein
MEKCRRFLDKFRAGGWKVWQMQFRCSEPEGFHAWFMNDGQEDIEIVTHDEEVQKAIIEFNAKK